MQTSIWTEWQSVSAYLVLIFTSTFKRVVSNCHLILLNCNSDTCFKKLLNPQCFNHCSYVREMKKPFYRQTIRTVWGWVTSRYAIWSHTFTVICNGWPRLDSSDCEKCSIKYRILHLFIPSWDLQCTVSQISKVHIPYIICVLFCDLRCFYTVFRGPYLTFWIGS